MAMDIHLVNDTDDADLKSGMIESDIFTNMLTRLEVDLAYSSEKLVNLELYMTVVSLEDSGLEEVDIEKALMFDLLFGYIRSEVTELEHFLCVLQAQIAGPVDVESTLHQFGSSWKDLQEKVSEMKQQLADLHRSLSILGPNSLYLLEDENSDFVLGMLEKSLASELDLKRQLLESREKEEELKLKLLLINEAISKNEMYTEIALERLLEAELSSEMLMRFAKEMMFRFQILQFNLHCSSQREAELKSELQRSSEQLKKKDYSLAEVQRSCNKMKQHSQDKSILEERIKVVEKKLNDSESKLEETRESYEASQEQVSLMEDAIESLREHVFMAESRAHGAETKLIALTEENMELREEVGFLKGGDGNEEKMGSLEKQVRDLEAQLQTARASSDMLYTAIWDMETLIEDLNTKVSKAESTAENAQEQCLASAEINLEHTKKICFLKSKADKLEESLREANREKLAWGKDINNGTKLVTDMVMQLATERERIQKQLSSLERENKILLQELRKMKNNSFNFKANNNNELGSTGITRRAASATPTSATATASNRVQLDQDEAEAETASASDAAIVADFPICETLSKGRRNHLHYKFHVFAAIFVLAFSILAMINFPHIFSIMRH